MIELYYDIGNIDYETLYIDGNKILKRLDFRKMEI